jgi:peptidoglycan/LPS O-acetylase OafA/YrhL
VANFFYLNTDYFASPAQSEPLLHTWSLAVEEQFYLFFPVLLWLLHRYMRQYLWLFLATICHSPAR